jgi:hypothetical protein
MAPSDGYGLQFLCLSLDFKKENKLCDLVSATEEGSRSSREEGDRSSREEPSIYGNLQSYILINIFYY